MKKMRLRWGPERMGKRFSNGKISLMSDEVENPQSVKMTTNEAARYLGITRAALFNYVSNGVLKVEYVHKKKVLVKLSDLDEMIRDVLIPAYNRRLMQKVQSFKMMGAGYVVAA